MENTSKRPFGFYVCSVAFSLERFSFYSAKWLIAMFVVHSVAKGGLGLTAADAAKMSANLIAWTYFAPLIGSWISDRKVGARYLIPMGMMIMGAGYLVGWKATSALMVNAMIILVAIGTGLFKSQLSGITGRLFDNQKDLDSAFSTQYSFVNIGSFIGTTVLGLIGESIGYSFCFLICAIVMFINTAWFVFGWKFLGDAGKKPFKIDEHKEVKEEKKEEKKPLTTIEKKRVGAIILISFFSIVFWIFWQLAYMPVYFYWAGDNGLANWMIGNFKVPTAWFDSLNALCCIVLGPILGKVWEKLAKRPQGDMSMFKKTALGMLLLGLSYVIFAMADVLRGDNLLPLAWLVVFGIVLALGEMVFSPLGNSFISKFSPGRVLTTMMSVWVLASFVAGQSYGYVYEFTLKFKFAPTYFVIAAIAIVCGIILWALDGKLNSLVVDEKVVEDNSVSLN
ncbi:peptide MFS transporter [Clostridium sporogenes]|uniref:Amino acid/peptide transporter family protein n=1 Tax=Clostridium sporogenes TaxID=1509 RepID=A0A1L3NDJ3_CLOSG|nr:peptide MFS transporter [Clostridium sporogenes]APH14199.1 amino acid/peptide transporter family protein [Clostridium sporogenes]